MTIKIQIPKNNIPERKYILDVFFAEFLGVEYKIEEAEIDSNKIFFNDKVIEFKDSFFNQFTQPLDYLKEANIPNTISFAENQFTKEENIPVIYGDTEIDISNNHIYCGIDIFASSFFMLTRWEEHVILDKDKHGRVSDSSQLSVKQNFNERPVVNEYVEMLRNMFTYLGFEINNKNEYKIKITHDIDFFARYNNFSKVIKAIGGDIFKRRSFKKAINTIKVYSQIKNGIEKDPYNTFDYLMDLSENIGEKSYFYFIPALLGEEDSQYNITDKAVVETIKRIKDRGHIVGVHGAYSSYKDITLFREELNRFPENIEIKEGRQHFLRFKNPTTWQMYEDEGLRTDSTMGFINHIGFRSGTCFEYSVFNILTRKKLKLKEQPLAVMEQALIKKYSEKNDFLEKFIAIKDTVKKYKGTFVLLWHNNNFNVTEWEGFDDVYKKLIKEM